MYQIFLIVNITLPNNCYFILPDIGKKKITIEQSECLHTLKENIRCFMEKTIDNMHRPFTPLKKTISPWIDKLQVHLDIFPEKNKKNVSWLIRDL